MKVLIAGVGYTGRRVLTSLPADSVCGLSRSPSAVSVVHDFDSDDRLPVQLPGDYQVLYTVPPSSASPGDDRLQRLLCQLDPAPSRIVYISTTGVYGNRNGAVVTEESSPHPETERARRRVAAEQRLTDWCSQHSSDLLILRTPSIYGPGRLGIDNIKAGKPVLRADEAAPGNRIHIDDLVHCCLAALQRHSPAGIYNLGDGDHRSGTWFSHEVARQCGLEKVAEISLQQAKRQFSALRLSFLLESRCVDTEKMRHVLGVRPYYRDARKGIAASLPD